MRKHMPPVNSDWDTLGPSRDLPAPPTEKRPKPKMRALRTSRMRRLVRLRVSTSEVLEALAINSIAVAIMGASPAISIFLL